MLTTLISITKTVCKVNGIKVCSFSFWSKFELRTSD